MWPSPRIRLFSALGATNSEAKHRLNFSSSVDGSDVLCCKGLGSWGKCANLRWDMQKCGVRPLDTVYQNRQTLQRHPGRRKIDSTKPHWLGLLEPQVINPNCVDCRWFLFCLEAHAKGRRPARFWNNLRQGFGRGWGGFHDLHRLLKQLNPVEFFHLRVTFTRTSSGADKLAV